mmetsp:Transcript_18097/g.41053  ORF Transcript_18097/g.41053 Transcript_18097/m.41053 type:complete len:247 (+) Transcript_18097:674-1414(+)
MLDLDVVHLLLEIPGRDGGGKIIVHVHSLQGIQVDVAGELAGGAWLGQAEEEEGVAVVLEPGALDGAGQTLDQVGPEGEQPELRVGGVLALRLHEDANKLAELGQVPCWDEVNERLADRTGERDAREVPADPMAQGQDGQARELDGHHQRPLRFQESPPQRQVCDALVHACLALHPHLHRSLQQAAYVDPQVFQQLLHAPPRLETRPVPPALDQPRHKIVQQLDERLGLLAVSSLLQPLDLQHLCG